MVSLNEYIRNSSDSLEDTLLPKNVSIPDTHRIVKTKNYAIKKKLGRFFHARELIAYRILFYLGVYVFFVFSMATMYYVFTKNDADKHWGVESITYADMLYFSIVTCSTVGYGDITPKSSRARMLVSFNIMLMIIVPILAIVLQKTEKYSDVNNLLKVVKN